MGVEGFNVNVLLGRSSIMGCLRGEKQGVFYRNLRLECWQQRLFYEWPVL